jgi:hypothetical protein
MLFYLLAGLVFIALVVFLVFAAKNWHWLHVTAVVLVYLTAVPGFYCAGFVLKTRKAVVKEFAESKLSVENERKRYLSRLYGDQPGPQGGFGEGSLKAEVSRYMLLTMGKGRSWDEATLQARNETQVTFAISQPAAAVNPDDALGADPALPAAAAPAAAEPTPGLYPTVGALVYAFQLTGMTIEANRQVAVAGNYLGSYRVTTVNGSEVVAVPVVVMESDLMIGGSVALFEKPPVDTHDVMVAALGFAQDAKPTIDEFRQKFQEVFPPESFNLDASSAFYQRMVDEFSFDGRSIATEIDPWLSAQGRPALNPAAEEVLVVSRVLRNLEESVDGTQDMVTSGVFDSLGRANDPDLQLGGPARVAASRPGDDTDVILIDEPTAALGYTRQDGTQVKSWEEEGKSESINRIYSRRLRDYTSEIEQVLFDADIVGQRIEEYTRLNANAREMLEFTLAQQTVRDAKISDLTTDQQNLKSDLQVVDTYATGLDARLTELRREIRDNYLQISRLHQLSVQEADAWGAAQD